MGWLFKTPGDDATEATLRALHWQNTLDNYYEYGWGWVRTIIAAALGVFITSAFEASTGISLWENTVEWFGEWAYEKVEGWVK